MVEKIETARLSYKLDEKNRVHWQIPGGEEGDSRPFGSIYEAEKFIERYARVYGLGLPIRQSMIEPK